MMTPVRHPVPIAHELLGQISSGQSALSSRANQVFVECLPACHTQNEVLVLADDVLRRDHLANLVRGGLIIQPWGATHPHRGWSANPVSTEDEIWQAPIASPQHNFRVQLGRGKRNAAEKSGFDLSLCHNIHYDLAHDMGVSNTRIGLNFYDDVSLNLILAAIESHHPDLAFTWRMDTRLVSAREYATALTQMVQPALLTTTLVNGLHGYNGIHPHTALRHDLFHILKRKREMARHTQIPQEFANLLTGLGWVALAMENVIEEMSLTQEEQKSFRLAQEAVLDGESTLHNENLLEQIFLRVFNTLTDTGAILKYPTEDKLEKMALCQKFLTLLDQHINLVMAEHPSRGLFQETIKRQIHRPLGLDVN